ncbi:hypothetical protein GJR88_04866 [Dietzia sp. DQ12-45-1b]|nr:hypothetical protein GJR88_04866 [Dietzia sp. DQ12-45-1b]
MSAHAPHHSGGPRRPDLIRQRSTPVSRPVCSPPASRGRAPLTGGSRSRLDCDTGRIVSAEPSRAGRPRTYSSRMEDPRARARSRPHSAHPTSHIEEGPS